MQTVPQSFHNIGLPTLVSRIAIVHHKCEPKTILMLDINQTLNSRNQKAIAALYTK
ncbi:hypothetical protein [Calothrix sp. NIES-2098]|uniref:hypothetical protein n=1 Tax=Calothrix sp. NIES-2098 TaxID=1954171 RepID=UPI000B61A30A|nr:hypothetical protein NIES2098_58400 [Calothrix sp. NIES-2098]